MTDTRTDAFPVWILVILAMGLLVLGTGGTWYYNRQAKTAFTSLPGSTGYK